ncbi:hypothetical protein N574_0119205 [Lactiplantibacillus plantarum 2165]|nr:hypothetical protein N574_0119205 [Lactiplantibacillus plantarum 2165]
MTKTASEILNNPFLNKALPLPKRNVKHLA